jgi:hypothetical protein
VGKSVIDPIKKQSMILQKLLKSCRDIENIFLIYLTNFLRHFCALSKHAKNAADEKVIYNVCN